MRDVVIAAIHFPERTGLGFNPFVGDQMEDEPFLLQLYIAVHFKPTYATIGRLSVVVE